MSELAQLTGIDFEPKVEPTDDRTLASSLISDRKFTKSQTIRYLHAEGWSTARIAKAMPDYDDGSKFRYQHVRNVLKQELKKG